MTSKRLIAILLASAALIWGAGHAAPEATEALPEGPGVIIFELQPMQPMQPMQPGMEAGRDHRQAIMSLLLLQLLMGMQMQMESESVEVQRVAPPAGQMI